MVNFFVTGSLGFCWWDLPALLVLVAVVLVYAVNIRKLKNERKELEDQLSGSFADETLDINTKA